MPPGLAEAVVQSHKLPLSFMDGVPFVELPMSSKIQMVGSSMIQKNYSWKGVGGTKGKRQSNKGLSHLKGIEA